MPFDRQRLPLPRRLPAPTLPALAFVAMTIPACVDPGASRPVLAQQRDAIERLERASAEDLAALRALADAMLDARRERLLASIELGLVADALDERGDAPPDAPEWLADYASLVRAGAPAHERRDALRSLPAVVAFDETASALLASLDGRALATASLFAQALADNATLADAAGATADLGSVSREAAAQLWRAAVLDRIDDPAQRDAAARLLDNLLNPSN